MLENVEYLVLLLPGFFIYITLHRLLSPEEKRDTLETSLYSLFLSLITYSVIAFLANHGFLTLNIIDWKFSLSLVLTSMGLTCSLFLFFKYLFPLIEDKLQLFDAVKYKPGDIIFDVLMDNMNKSNKPIWLQIVTKDNLTFTGYISRFGLTKDKKPAIYVKSPKLTTKNAKFNIESVQGILFTLDNIKWLGILNLNSSEKETTKKSNSRR